MAHIQIDDRLPRVYYTVGATPQTAFEVPFAFFDDGDLDVYVDGVLKIISTDYTVSGAGLSVGGTVTFVVAKSSTDIAIVRTLEISRVTDFPASGPFDIDALNTELDRIVAMEQESRSIFDRSVTLPESEAGIDLELPPAADRANTAITFDADGNMILLPVVAGELQPGAANITYTPPWANSQPRSLASVLEERLSILDFIPAAQWTAIANYTSNYDCLAAMRAAHLAANGRPVFYPPGLYNSSGSVIKKSSTTLPFVPGLKVHGAGMSFGGGMEGTVFKVTNSNVPLFFLTQDTVPGKYTEQSEFFGFSVICAAGVTNVAAVEMVAAWNVTIRRIAAFGARIAVARLHPEINPISDFYQCYSVDIDEVYGVGCENWAIEYSQGQSPGLYHIRRAFLTGNLGGGIYLTTGQSLIEQCNVQVNGSFGNGTAGIRFDTAEGPSQAPVLIHNEVQENQNYNFIFIRVHALNMYGNRSLGHLYSSTADNGVRWSGSVAPVPAGYVARPLVHIQLGIDAYSECYNFNLRQNVIRLYESTVTPVILHAFGGGEAINYGRVTQTEWQIHRNIPPENNIKFYSDGFDQSPVYTEGPAPDSFHSVVTSSPILKCAVEATTGTAQALAGIMVFGTEQRDTHAAYNNATGIFTVPYSGQYQFAGQIGVPTAAGATGVTIQLFNTGVGTPAREVRAWVPTGIADVTVPFDFTINALLGDAFSIEVFVTGTARSCSANALYNFLEIEAMSIN